MASGIRLLTKTPGGEAGQHRRVPPSAAAPHCLNTVTNLSWPATRMYRNILSNKDLRIPGPVIYFLCGRALQGR